MGGILGFFLVGCGFSVWIFLIVLRKDWRFLSRGFFSGKDVEVVCLKDFFFWFLGFWFIVFWGKLGILFRDVEVRVRLFGLVWIREVIGFVGNSGFFGFDVVDVFGLWGLFIFVESVFVFSFLKRGVFGVIDCVFLVIFVCFGFCFLYRFFLVLVRRFGRERFLKCLFRCRVVGLRCVRVDFFGICKLFLILVFFWFIFCCNDFFLVKFNL